MFLCSANTSLVATFMESHAKVSAHAGAWRNEFRGDHACTLRVYLGTKPWNLGRMDTSIYRYSHRSIHGGGFAGPIFWKGIPAYPKCPRSRHSTEVLSMMSCQWGTMRRARSGILDSPVKFASEIPWTPVEAVYILRIYHVYIFWLGFHIISTGAGSPLWLINTSLSWKDLQWCATWWSFLVVALDNCNLFLDVSIAEWGRSYDLCQLLWLKKMLSCFDAGFNGTPQKDVWPKSWVPLRRGAALASWSKVPKLKID